MITGTGKRGLGQSLVEYCLLIAAFVAAIIAIQVYVSRSIKGRIKSDIDNYGEQYSDRWSRYTYYDVHQSKSEDVQKEDGEFKSTLLEHEIMSKEPYGDSIVDDFSGKGLTQEDLWD